MKVSLNWLREYVDFPGDAPSLADLLTMAGVEVEGIEQRGVAIDNVVVAQIRESVQHPNADRLSVCQVDDGSGQLRQIVCGAKNYKVNDKVPLALPGAVLPGDFKIKVGKLRGVESQGMMCSPKELGLAEDADGLLILPETATIGSSMAELYPPDTVLDLEITPNRPDLLSHIGIAREVAALSRGALKVKLPRGDTRFAGPVEVEASESPFYTARRISGVKVEPSPAWLRQKLELVGLRAINNIVDITNYVMLEIGQPLHAFDAAKLQGDLRVRLAADGEQFMALDGRTYELNGQHLVIADGARAVALAGVMGGEDSGVTASTTDIWLESAYFLPSNIRRTSRGLGLLSDSSYRFERDVNPAGILVASQRAAELIAELCGGQIGELRAGFAANAQFGFDEEAAADGVEYGAPVPLRIDRCEELLGVEIPEERIDEILNGFGLRKSDDGWLVPSYRPDISREVDLIEEVARVIGIDVIPAQDCARFIASSDSDRRYDRLMEVRRALASQGLHEARTLTLVSEKLPGMAATQTSAESLLRVKNPMNEDHAVLRPKLLPGLLRAVTHNARAGVRNVRLFEVGQVYAKGDVEEVTHAGFVLSGPVAQATWRGGEIRTADLFDVKGILAQMFGAGLEYRPSKNESLALSLEILWNGDAVGYAGQLWPTEARGLDALAPVIFAEVSLDGLLAVDRSAARYREIPRFPQTTRDIAMLAPVTLAHEEVEKTLLGAGEPLLEAVELFDVFTDPAGEKVPADKKSVAYSLTYRSSERTLTADQVNAAHSRLKERLKTALGVHFRE
jgi:phenylalanyl-tRNA synthetase beta chain